MLINLFKTCNRSFKLIILTILCKIFLGRFATKTAELRQKSIDRQLPAIDYRQQIHSHIEQKALLPDDIPTQILTTAKSPIAIQSNQNISPNLKLSRYTKKSLLKSSKLLLNLAKVDFEQKIIDTFVKRLYHPTPLQLELINNNSISEADRLITIVSSFKISQENQVRLIAAMEEIIASNIKVKFKIAKDLICRIELCDRSYKIAWDLEHYWTELEPKTL